MKKEPKSTRSVARDALPPELTAALVAGAGTAASIAVKETYKVVKKTITNKKKAKSENPKIILTDDD